jgi:type II secretory pathway component PulF
MQPIEQRLLDLEKKVDAMTAIVKKLYFVFLAGVILSVLAFVIPLIGLLFAIPKFLSTYNSSMLGL